MRRVPLALIALFCSVAFTNVANAVVAPITSSIAANTTWGLVGSGSTVEADVFWIQNPIYVNPGFTLTMKSGIVVKFSQYATLTVNGALQAQGSGANIIYITSIKDDTHGGDTNLDGGGTVPNPSDWGGITFSSMSPDSSRMAFCDIAYGGYYLRGVLAFSPGISGVIRSSTIRKSYVGVDVQGNATPLLVDCSIQTSTLGPVALDIISNPILNRLTFSFHDNGYDAFLLRGGTLATTASLPKRAATVGATLYNNITYALFSSLTIAAAGSLTIASGVVIKPIAGYGIYAASGGNLTMNGVPGDSITVTSIYDDTIGQPTDTSNNGSIITANRGDWDRIYYASGSTGSMQYCRLLFGTNNATYGLVDITDVNLLVSNSLLSAASHGVVLHGTSPASFTNVAFLNMTSTPVLMSVTANPTFTGGSLSGNAITALGLIGEAVASSAHLIARNMVSYTNITYYLMNGSLDMQPGTTLTIDPGLVIKVQIGGNAIVIEGTLSANGTIGSPIVFTSERDDNWGNPLDTNGDGGGTSAAPADWAYLVLTATANNASVINYCRLQYGSQGPYDYPTTLWIHGCSPTISNCNINYGRYGIRIDGVVTPTIGIRDTVTHCTAAPIVMSAMCNPTITQPYFKNNGMNGLALLAEALTQNSTIRYRPGVTFQPPDAPVPFAYVITGTITVNSGVTLAIEPQVVLKVFGGNPAISVSGILNAVGSGLGANRIIFTSFRDDALGGDTNNDQSGTTAGIGDWATAIQFNSTAVSAQCILRNVLFTFGGSGGAANATVTTFSTSPRITRTDFQFDRAALTFNGNSNPTVDTVSVINSTTIPVAFSLLANPIFTNITWSGNPYTVLGILGEVITQNVHLINRTLGAGIFTNISYALVGDINIASGATWTINPGIVIKLGRYAYDPTGLNIGIDGALIANGKPDSLIVFTSMADDLFGGDNNNDGVSSQPAQGNWGGINFTAISNSAATVVNNVRLRYGGVYSTWGMSFTNTNTTVSNTFLTGCYQGLYVAGAAAPVFNNVNIDSSAWMPVRMSLVSNPTFNNVQFAKNALTGLGVISETIAQDLLWKIRPISGRLNMPYILDGTLGVGLGSTLTCQPGLIVKFKANYGGGITANRAFFALGRTIPESLIVFTSTRDDFYGGRSDTTAAVTPPASGDWSYVTIMNTAIAGQVAFRNCVFRYGGSGPTYGALRAYSSAYPVDSTLFAYNQTGVSAEGSGNPVIHGCSFYGNTYEAVTNTGTSFCTDATGCWWGAASGPNDANAAADICGAGVTNAGSGDAVTNNVNYSGFVTTGVQNPVLGDVTLNGVVTALDASYILQYLATTLTLNPLQKLVADVDLTAGIAPLDASLILMLVTGNIVTLPGYRTGLMHAPPDEVAAALDITRRAHGTFSAVLRTPRREGDRWALPVSITGDAPIYGAELTLEGANAASISDVVVASGALHAIGTPDGAAKVVFAAGHEIPAGEMATLYFPAGATGDWVAPQLTWARVNNDLVALGPAPPAAPEVSFLARPTPNPARGQVGLSLGVSARDAGSHARVAVLDLAGRRVRTLLDGALPAGIHDLTWDLRDATGRLVSPGVYLLRAQSGAFSAVRHLIVVR